MCLESENSTVPTDNLLVPANENWREKVFGLVNKAVISIGSTDEDMQNILGQKDLLFDHVVIALRKLSPPIPILVQDLHFEPVSKSLRLDSLVRNCKLKIVRGACPYEFESSCSRRLPVYKLLTFRSEVTIRTVLGYGEFPLLDKREPGNLSLLEASNYQAASLEEVLLLVQQLPKLLNNRNLVVLGSPLSSQGKGFPTLYIKAGDDKSRILDVTFLNATLKPYRHYVIAVPLRDA